MLENNIMEDKTKVNLALLEKFSSMKTGAK